MPILGNLSEFPLPEVLLLIGTRTGRLRLLDVPEYGIMDIDFSNGEAQAMQLGESILTEPEEMIAKLSAVVQAQAGMFEFQLHPVASVSRPKALMVNELVMSLVCHVDEQVARQRAPASFQHWYILEAHQPEIWVEPELDGFFTTARPFLASGVYLETLAKHLHLDVPGVHKHLTNLRLLGLVMLVDGTDTARMNEFRVQETISRKSNDFLRASRAAGEIQKVTAKLTGIKTR